MDNGREMTLETAPHIMHSPNFSHKILALVTLVAKWFQTHWFLCLIVAIFIVYILLCFTMLYYYMTINTTKTT
jgi:hypothetical protein